MAKAPVLSDALRDALCSDTFDTFHDALLSITDPRVLDAMIKGLRYHKKGQSFSCNNSLYGKRSREAHRALAAVLLAPVEMPRIVKFRDQVTKIYWAPQYMFRDETVHWPLDAAAIAERFPSIKALDLRGVRLTNLAALAQLDHLGEIKFSDCHFPEGLTGLEACTQLTSLELHQSLLEGAFVCPPSVEVLVCDDLDGLEALDGFVGARALTRLRLSACPALRGLDGLETCNNLETLRIRALENLTRLWIEPAPEGVFENLKVLGIADSPSLTSLAGWPSQLPRLSDLTLDALPSLTSLEGLPDVPELQDLTFRGLSSLASFAGMPRVPRLVQWWRYNDAITSLDGIEAFAHLEALSFNSPALVDLSALSALRVSSHVTSLTIRGAVQLSDLAPIAVLAKSLTELVIDECSSISELAPLQALKKLRHLSLKGATSVTRLDVLATLPTLASIDLRGCTGITIASVRRLIDEARALRVIALDGTPVERSSMSESHFWYCTWHEDPPFRKLARRKPPKKNSAATSVSNRRAGPDPTYERLKRMVRETGDHDAAIELERLATRYNDLETAAFAKRVRAPLAPQLLEDLRSTETLRVHGALTRCTPDIFDKLLEHMVFKDRGFESRSEFLSNLEHQRVLSLLIMLHAPAEHARVKALAPQCESLYQSDNEPWPFDRPFSVAFDAFACFSHLTSLDVRHLDLTGRLPTLPTLTSFSAAYGSIEPDALEFAGEQLTRVHLSHMSLPEVFIPPQTYDLDLDCITELPSFAAVRGALSDVGELHLKALPQLTSLEGIERGVSLAYLSLAELPSLASLAGLEACTSLESIYLDACAVTSLEPLRALDALTECTIYRATTLRKLAGLPRGLTTLKVQDVPALDDLSGLAEAPQLEHIEISKSERLERLDGIESLGAVVTAELVGHAALRDVSALARLPHLRALSLRACRALQTADVRPLADSTSLRGVNLYGTPVVVDELEANSRWLFSSDRYVYLRDLCARVPPVTIQPVAKGDKKKLSALRKKLKSKDVDLMTEGLEELRALAQPELFDALLTDCTLEPSTRGYGYGGRGVRIKSKKFGGGYGHFVIMGLLNAAPEESACARMLRAEITNLAVYGTRNEKLKRPFDPYHLENMTSLTQLGLDRVGPFTTPRKERDSPPRIPQLKHLWLKELWGLASLWWLEGATGLETLRVEGVGSLEGLQGAVSLKTFRGGGRSPRDLDILLGLPKLEHVEVYTRSDIEEQVNALRARGVKVDLRSRY